MNTTMRILSILPIALLFLLGCERLATKPNNTGDVPFPFEGPYRITISGETNHLARPNDTLLYHVTVLNRDSNVVRDSTTIRWTCSGRGTWIDLLSWTHNGIATNRYRLGRGIGVDTLHFKVNGDTSSIDANLLLHLDTGQANRIVVSPAQISGRVGFYYQRDIAVYVEDSIGNAVNDPVITTSAPSGVLSLNRVSNDGDSLFYLYQFGTTTGTSWIRFATGDGVTDSLQCTALSGSPTTISISPDTSQIEVAGAYGLDSTRICVRIIDEFGNPASVQIAFDIVNAESFGFEWINQPNFFGCQGITHVFGELDSTGTIAPLIHSGNRTGIVQLRMMIFAIERSKASFESLDTTVSLSIIAGSPAMIDVSWDRSSLRADGGGLVSASVQAQVTDRLGNPVRNNTAVRFLSIPDSLAFINPAVTGNPNPNGQRIPGVAFSRIEYQSSNAFDSIMVRALTDSRDSAGTSIVVAGECRGQLPLYDGQISIAAYPAIWNYTHSGSPAIHSVCPMVVDGYGNRILNAPVFLTTDVGFFYAPDDSLFIHPMRSIQLLSGECALLRVTEEQTFPIPGTLESTNEVTAFIEGYVEIPTARFVINYQRN